jgi:hypothetical protein
MPTRQSCRARSSRLCATPRRPRRSCCPSGAACSPQTTAHAPCRRLTGCTAAPPPPVRAPRACALRVEARCGCELPNSETRDRRRQPALGWSERTAPTAPASSHAVTHVHAPKLPALIDTSTGGMPGTPNRCWLSLELMATLCRLGAAGHIGGVRQVRLPIHTSSSMPVLLRLVCRLANRPLRLRAGPLGSFLRHWPGLCQYGLRVRFYRPVA